MKIIKQANAFQKDVRKQTGIALSAALAFVIAFSWNEFMKESVTSIVALTGIQSIVLLRLIAAIFATVIGIIGISYFSKWGK